MSLLNRWQSGVSWQKEGKKESPSVETLTTQSPWELIHHEQVLADTTKEELGPVSASLDEVMLRNAQTTNPSGLRKQTLGLAQQVSLGSAPFAFFILSSLNKGPLFVTHTYMQCFLNPLLKMCHSCLRSFSQSNSQTDVGGVVSLLSERCCEPHRCSTDVHTSFLQRADDNWDTPETLEFCDAIKLLCLT